MKGNMPEQRGAALAPRGNRFPDRSPLPDSALRFAAAGSLEKECGFPCGAEGGRNAESGLFLQI